MISDDKQRLINASLLSPVVGFGIGIMCIILAYLVDFKLVNTKKSKPKKPGTTKKSEKTLKKCLTTTIKCLY